MPDIVLATHNARWIHTAFGLRCLRANLGALRERSCILELELATRAADAAEAILRERPRILGLGVHVWNARQARELADVVTRVAPEVTLVVGGPEVSHEADAQPICAVADHVVQGEGEHVFAELCRDLLGGARPPRMLVAPPLPPDELVLPYDEYTDEDIAHRVVYVEASRGCPFTCEFCLSALDEGVRRFPLDRFLAAMQRLLDRGLRHFKFVDRTFNVHIPSAVAILRFFRERWRPGMLLHFEVVPDRLPDALRGELAAFPAGGLQLEVGVQTFAIDVAARVGRRQDPETTGRNLEWLRTETGAHLHADLIVGLPGEDAASFAVGFDRLWRLRPQEIQVGILKRLRGAPIARHDAEWGMVWSPEPPYELLASRSLPFAELQALKRFARYWDLVGNRGHLGRTLELLLQDGSPFARFAALAKDLHRATGATFGIALPRLAELVFRHLVDARGLSRDEVGRALAADWRRSGRHDWPRFLQAWMLPGDGDRRRSQAADPRAARQARHRAAGGDAAPRE